MREEIKPGRTLHFIGIGGIGMSGIARLCLGRGCRVQGSDIKHSELLTELETVGAKVFVGHDAGYVAGADVVVYSSSIPEDHPERLEAKRLGLKQLHRADALAELCRGKYTIAVAGTHGKTTTTALVGSVLKEAGREPSIVVGGVVSSFGGNVYQGKGREIVIEADESDSSFLKFNPSMAVVTNVDEEHLDHFKDIEDIERAFGDFLRGLVKGGQWFGCAEDERVRRLAKKIGHAELYGFDRKTARWVAENIRECPEGQRGAVYDAWRDGVLLGEVRLKIVGRHNVLNSIAAIAVGMKLGIPFPTVAHALGHYPGAGRRFDVKYEDKDILIVDDYAHHPTEIQKTLEAARALKKKRIVAVFQPHRYSRTELLLKQFGRSFRDADMLIVTDIYAASEVARPGVTGRAFLEEVFRAGQTSAQYIERSQLAEGVFAAIRPGDLVLVMGAGDISQVAKQLADRLRQDGAGDPFQSLAGRVFKNEMLSKHTTLKIGGPVDYWIEPADEKDLKEALRLAKSSGIPVAVFGSGSNVLPPDEGLRGAAIHLSSAHFREIRSEDGVLIARAGVPNTLFIQFAMQQGLGGCEFLLGIPGNIGGAIAMNAGSHGQWIAPSVQTVTTMTFDGERRVRKAEEIPFGYRKCDLPGEVIIEASFVLPKVDRVDVQNRLEEYRQYRVSTQDLRYPSAGCMFKNPDRPGCSSGRLIDEAGLKGLRVGNAQVSEKHANFIVNLGGATAKDIKTLIEQIQKVVREKDGITLETEVRILK